MNTLSDILTDLGDTDLTLGKLRALAGKEAGDEIAHVNMSALAKRRRDIERKLEAVLRVEQRDLVNYRVEREDGEVTPVAAVAGSILLFQEIVTAVFDAVRDEPRRHYEPSPENAALSAMTFAASPGDNRSIALTIPNDRLLAIRSDLDLVFELVFALFRLRSTNDFIRFAERTGVSSITKLHQWTGIVATHGLSTAITWQKTREASNGITISSREAAALRNIIESASEETIEDRDIEGRLVSLDEARSTFCLQVSADEQISGLLAYEFPRGKQWTTNVDLVAMLKRSTRVDFATGAETSRWTLKRLIQLD